MKKPIYLQSAICRVSPRYSGKIFKKTLCVIFTSILLLGCKKNLENTEIISEATGKTPGASISSGNLWYDKFVAYESVNGGNSYNSTSTATLAWGESYMLRCYVMMWELTKDTAWLIS